MRQTKTTAPAYSASYLSLWGPLLLWLVLIFIISSFHKMHIPKSKYISWDKLAHVCEYAVLGYLTARALWFAGWHWLKSNYLWIAIVFGLLYALSDEFHQYFVPGRSSSLYDAFADLVGVVVGCLVFRTFLAKGRFMGSFPPTKEMVSEENKHIGVK